MLSRNLYTFDKSSESKITKLRAQIVRRRSLNVYKLRYWFPGRLYSTTVIEKNIAILIELWAVIVGSFVFVFDLVESNGCFPRTVSFVLLPYVYFHDAAIVQVLLEMASIVLCVVFQLSKVRAGECYMLLLPYIEYCSKHCCIS